MITVNKIYVKNLKNLFESDFDFFPMLEGTRSAPVITSYVNRNDDSAARTIALKITVLNIINCMRVGIPRVV